MPPEQHQDQRRNTQEHPPRQHYLPQRALPGVRIQNRQIRGPEHLPQIAAIRNHRVPDPRPQGQARTRLQRAIEPQHHAAPDDDAQHVDKERDLLHEQGRESGA